MQINRWTETFEVADSRRPKSRMEWYKHPVDLMSKGMIELTGMGADGLIAIAVFNLLCQWSAGQRLELRGKLQHSDGSTLSAEYISRAVNVSVSNVSKSLEILTKVGWIEQTRSDLINIDQVRSSLIKDDQKCALEEKRREETKGEEKKKDTGVYSPEFELFWSAFPRGRKSGKKTAYAAFKKALKETTTDILIDSAGDYAASDTGQGEFVKGPTPWLNGGCWDDDRESWRNKKTANKPTTFESQKRANMLEAGRRFLERRQQEGGESNGTPRISG